MNNQGHPGSCERCGREQDVHFIGWQFLCKLCRETHEHAETRVHLPVVPPARRQLIQPPPQRLLAR
jgi:hypothetical protein